MTKTVLDIDAAETSELRDLYRTSCNERKLDCKWVGKMGRPELLKKIRILIDSGDIVVERKREQLVCNTDREEKPYVNDGASAIRYPLSTEVDDCLHLLLEAVRLYMKRDIWVSQGRGNDPQTKKYLKDAQECVRKAVGAAVGSAGEEWDKASKLAYCIDRALLKMRVDFNDTLASTCVMCALLSDKHTVEMAKAMR